MAKKTKKAKNHKCQAAIKYHMSEGQHDVKVLVACEECKKSFFYLHSKRHTSGSLTTIIKPGVPSSDELEFPAEDQGA